MIIIQIIMTGLIFVFLSKLYKQCKEEKYSLLEFVFSIYLIQSIFIPGKGVTSKTTENLGLYIEIGILVICILMTVFVIIRKRIRKLYIFDQSSKYILCYFIFILFLERYPYVQKGNMIYWLTKYLFTFLLVHTLVAESLKLKRKPEFIIDFLCYTLMFLQSYVWIYSWINFNRSFGIVSTGYMRFGGEMVHPTTMSTISGILVGYSAFKIFYDKKNVDLNSLNLIISLVSLIATMGRTGILITFIVVFIFSFKHMTMKKVVLINTLIVFLSIFAFYVQFNEELKSQMFMIASRGQGTEGISNISGRKDVFDYAIYLIKEKPLLGYGYMASEPLMVYSGQPFSAYSFGIDSAYLTLALETGIVGLSLYLISIIKVFTFIRIKRKELNKKGKSFSYFLIVKVMFWITILNAAMAPSFGNKARIYTLILFTLMFNNIFLSKRINC